MSYPYPPFPKAEPLVALKRNERYKGYLPEFFNPEWFPELTPLTDNWQAIRDEILNYEKLYGSIKGLNSNPYVSALSEGVDWSNIYLLNFLMKYHKNQKKFPVTMNIINRIPMISLAVISVLSPNTIIKPHFGDTNGIVRCQLGLVIPGNLPECGIRVNNKEQGWEEGKLIIFTEAYLHSAWNNTDSKRYVLIIDLVPAFMNQSQITVCSKLLGAQSYNYLEKRFGFLEKIPDWTANFICSILAIGWRLYLPIQRRLKFL